MRFWISLIAVTVALRLHAQELEVGFASEDITPAVGAEMPGGFDKLLSKGTRDPLYAVAAVISDGKTPVALVGIDSLFTPKSSVQLARELIEKSTPIRGQNVLVSASHTHSGGPIDSCFGTSADPAYVERVGRAIAAAVERAWKSRQKSELGIGTGKEDSISFNRRFLVHGGREITHPGKPGTKNHSQIVRSAGPIDPDVGVLAARDAKRKVFGVVVNFACHVTVMGGDQFSADYVGALRKQLQAHYGEETQIVFLQGACGNITQVDNRSTAPEFGPDHVKMMGMKLASETIRTIARAAWHKRADITTAVESVPVAIRELPDADKERPPYGLGSGNNVEKYFASERKLVAEERARTPMLDCEVQAIRIGPLGIVTNGAEYFCEYALAIKKRSPFRPTWFVGYANENIGYVPTRAAFKGGGYETRTARSSKMEIAAGEKLEKTAMKALGRVASPIKK